MHADTSGTVALTRIVLVRSFALETGGNKRILEGNLEPAALLCTTEKSRKKKEKEDAPSRLWRILAPNKLRSRSSTLFFACAGNIRPQQREDSTKKKKNTKPHPAHLPTICALSRPRLILCFIILSAPQASTSPSPCHTHSVVTTVSSTTPLVGNHHLNPVYSPSTIHAVGQGSTMPSLSKWRSLGYGPRTGIL